MANSAHCMNGVVNSDHSMNGVGNSEQVTPPSMNEVGNSVHGIHDWSANLNVS